MKIICAGYWKTGTKSLAQALNILGYKVYDYDDQLFLLGDLWDKFFHGSVTDDDIRDKLKEVDVLIDGPVIAFWEEIHRVFPEAKVILTVRDEDSWWKSLKNHMQKTPNFLKFFFVLMYLTPTGNPFVRIGTRVANFCMGVEGLFTIPLITFTDNPRLYKYKFRQHNGYVMRSVPASNLLAYTTGDGWEPLCKFLDKEIPAGLPYPHKNKDAAHFVKEGGPQNAVFHQAKKETGIVFAIVILILALLVYQITVRIF